MNRHFVKDHTAVFAEAFFIANLLFVGIFYLALWLLFLFKYKQTSELGQIHLVQTLMASSLSTIIFAAINIFIIVTDGYASLTALLSLEIYFMVIVPLFLIAGIMGLTKAIRNMTFHYPLIGGLA